jgi:hypothetical protein
MTGKLITLYGESSIETTPGSRVVERKFIGNQIKWTQECITFGRQTRNGFTFNKNEFMDAIADPFVDDRIRGKRFYNEMDHPPKADYERFITVNMKEVCYRTNRFFFEGDKLYAECETIDIGNGKILRAMIEQDAEIAVSFRGFGIPKPEGGEKIKLVAFDAVFQPSDATALSKEESFKNKMYSEGYSMEAIINEMNKAGMLSTVNVPKTSSLYAESSLEGITPIRAFKAGGETLGIEYATKEEIERNAKAQGFRNFIINF